MRGWMGTPWETILQSRPAWPHDPRGGANAGYVVTVAIAALCIGALTNLGDSVGRNIDAQSQGEAAPTQVGSTNHAASSAEGDPSSDVLRPQGSQHPFGGAPAPHVPVDPKTSLSTEARAKANQASRQVLAQADRILETAFVEEGDALRISSFAASRISAEFPGRLPHDLPASIGRHSEQELFSTLNAMDRDTWSESPQGSKPVAAWSHGNAVGALLDDFILPPDLLDFVDGDDTGLPFVGNPAAGLLGMPFSDLLTEAALNLGDTRSGNDSTRDVQVPLRPGADPTPANPLGLAFAEGDNLSLAMQHYLEHLAPPTADELHAEVDGYDADIKRLNAQLEALESLEDLMGTDLSQYRDELEGALETTEELKLLTSLEQARTAWDENHGDKPLNADAAEIAMAELTSEGVMADIRGMYLGQGNPEPSAEALLLSIVGTDLHDETVQLALNERKESIQDEIERAKEALADQSSSMDTLSARAESFAATIDGKRDTVRASYAANASELQPLLDAHNTQHDKANQGFSKDAWNQYKGREGTIRELVGSANDLRTRDAQISDELRAFNKIAAAATGAAYDAVEPPSALDERKAPGFYDFRPLGMRDGYNKGKHMNILVVDIDGRGTEVELKTAQAYARMREAAKKDGIHLDINSAFRTNAEQQYFWNCYQTGSCNNGNQAAPPGHSEHQSGHALDLNTGGYGTKNYNWLKAHAHEFGFRETVAGEDWHWEYW